MPHAGDLDGVFVLVVEEHPVVGTAKPEACQRRPEPLRIPAAVCQVTTDTIQNLHGRLAVNGAQAGAGFRRPDYRDSLGRGFLTHWLSPNSRRISSCGMPSPRASDARARSSAAAVSGVTSSSSTGARASERSSGSTITSSRLRTAF